MSDGNRDEMPGAMAKRIPLDRVAQPEDIADAILFLMSNRYMTGATLTIDWRLQPTIPRGIRRARSSARLPESRRVRVRPSGVGTPRGDA